MHEISLVQGLLGQLDELAKENNKTKVLSITMTIGPLSGVVKDSFEFGFEILSKEDDLVRGAELIIETTAVTYRCTSCNKTETTADSRPEQCKDCGEFFLLTEGGDELVLEQVEME